MLAKIAITASEGDMTWKRLGQTPTDDQHAYQREHMATSCFICQIHYKSKPSGKELG